MHVVCQIWLRVFERKFNTMFLVRRKAGKPVIGVVFFAGHVTGSMMECKKLPF